MSPYLGLPVRYGPVFSWQILVTPVFCEYGLCLGRPAQPLLRKHHQCVAMTQGYSETCKYGVEFLTVPELWPPYSIRIHPYLCH